MERKDRTISDSREEWKITFLGRLSKRAIRQWRNLKARKTETIREISSAGFRVDLLLETARLPLSTYYYHFKQLWGLDKDKKFKAEIQAIFTEQKRNYGYHRMSLEWRNRGFVVNHKKVQHLMKALSLTTRIIRKRK